MDRLALGRALALLVRASLLQGATASKIRIEPGHGTNMGRLQVFHDETWGTVCDDNFGNVDARVACRALGMDSKYAVPWDFGPGSGPILLDDLACHGTEENLDDCLHNGWGNHECEHSEDIGVICTDDEVMITPTNVPVRVPEGDQVSFTCVALGDRGKPFQYQWSIGTQTTSQQSSILLTVGRHMFLNDSLTCSLISSDGLTLGSSTANIDVQYPPPAFTETSHAVFSGNDTCICRDGLGNPPATPTKWRKVGPTSRWNNCTSCMHDVDESDSGEYLVLVENTLVNNVMNTTKTGVGVQVVDLVIMDVEIAEGVPLACTCSPICKTYIVGGSLGLIILVLVGLVLIILTRRHYLPAEKTPPEGDKVENGTSHYYLHCVHGDQKHLSLSTCVNSDSRSEHPPVNVNKDVKHWQPHETVDEYANEPRYTEVETMVEGHDYEIV
ncbi:uncharacterized protein [Haliotis asinina]|uniref:uncharacterized protein n=1 Tax=Haliotis asinina TaxID=109174 RepID=UPI0035318022